MHTLVIVAIGTLWVLTVCDGMPSISDGAPLVNDVAQSISDGEPLISDGARLVSDLAQSISIGDPLVNDVAQPISDENQSVNDKASLEDDEAPSISDEAPSITDEAPLISDEAPSISDEVPLISDETPSISDEVSSISDGTSLINDVAPSISNETQPISDEAELITADCDPSDLKCLEVAARIEAAQALSNKHLFGGDMIVPVKSKNAITLDQMIWPNGIVPYVIDASLAPYKNLIAWAFYEYHVKTCIRFVPRTKEKNYIRIFSGYGCYSYVGLFGIGEQPVSLGKGCLYLGTIIHELSHALGFYHEQNRSDRDAYIDVWWENIQSGMESQFVKLQPYQNRLFNSFDFNSIMLYGETSFSKDSFSKTVTAKNRQAIREVYDKNVLSASDVARINTLYRCWRG